MCVANYDKRRGYYGRKEEVVGWMEKAVQDSVRAFNCGFSVGGERLTNDN